MNKALFFAIIAIFIVLILAYNRKCSPLGSFIEGHGGGGGRGGGGRGGGGRGGGGRGWGGRSGWGGGRWNGRRGWHRGWNVVGSGANWPGWWYSPYYFYDIPYEIDMGNSCNDSCLNSYKVCVDKGIQKEQCANILDGCLNKC